MRRDARRGRRRRVAARIALLAALLAVLAPERAEARRRFVPREHATLQAAIDAASPGDTVWVSGGVYRGPFTLKKKLVLFGDAGPDSTILDGGDSVRVLHVEGVNGGALIGFGIRGGKAVGGGGVYLLRDTTFAIDACSFRRNWESAVAAWECRGLRVADCRFQENRGSAMQWNDTDGVAYGLHFSGNRGNGGGALALYRSRLVLPVRNCSFDGNRAETTVGGAVYADSSRATFADCSFVGNSSAVAGGAVAAMARSHVTLSRSLFRENRAAQGGALHSDASMLLVGLSIFDRNRATAGGAAIGMLGRYDANINPVLQNNTFYKNHAEGSGATVFAVKTSPEIRKNIFVVEGEQQLAVSGADTSPLYECNLLHDPSGAAIGSLPSPDTVVGDPLFCDAPSGNFELGGLSPALRVSCGPIGARKQGCTSFRLQPSR